MATAALDSNVGFPESPLDDADAVFPCKGCGEILEEGKAFELAGNRWHIDCFRCNNCNTLLDSDANLLLLGDGSLICNNCTYSCHACGNKIEDLAILTGDQAFCSPCFRCRNCKRKIENLRYARTSQGIFCMRCHESLIEQRRKKARASKQNAAGSGSTTPAGGVLDKRLPALPPKPDPTATVGDQSSDSLNADVRSSQQSRSRANTLTTLSKPLSPLSTTSLSELDSQPISHSRDKPPENLILPASTYKDHSIASISPIMSLETDDDQAGLIPLAFDPSPMFLPPNLTPLVLDGTPELAGNRESQANQQDYFDNARDGSRSNLRDLLKNGSASRSASSERDGNTSKLAASPHIALQDRSRPIKRKEIGAETSSSTSPVISPPATTTERVLAPQSALSSIVQALGSNPPMELVSKELARSRKGSLLSETMPKLEQSDQGHFLDLSSLDSFHNPLPTLDTSKFLTPSKEKPNPIPSISPFDDPKPWEVPAVYPSRGDKLAAAARPNSIALQELPADDVPKAIVQPTTAVQATQNMHKRNTSTASAASAYVDAQSYNSKPNGLNNESPLRTGPDHARSNSRTSAPSKSVANDDFIAPRNPPAPPVLHSGLSSDQRNNSITSLHNTAASSPSRSHARNTSLGGTGGPSFEEELGKIPNRGLNTADENSGSLLRRVSNAAARHGRSFSEKSAPAIRGDNNQIQQSPTSGSPSAALFSHPPQFGDEVVHLKAHLRRSQQRIAELEGEKLGLQVSMAHTGDLHQVQTELREKRSTMASLDTQREMVIRELEVMKEHLTKAKDGSEPIDLTELKSDMLHDFSVSLQRLKDSVGVQIEDLVHRRNRLNDEIASLIQVKDKGLQEFEHLTSKNHQLNELNTHLLQNIQETQKMAARLPNGGNGMDLRSNSISSNFGSDIHSVTPPMMVDSPDSAQIQQAQQVVSIRKGQTPVKRFDWKKGGRVVAKNVTKNIKGAFAKDDVNNNGGGMVIGSPQPVPVLQTSESGSFKGASHFEAARAGLGFFGGNKNGVKPPLVGGGLKTSSSTNLLAIDPSVLFGSDLAARCDYENRILPAVVTRCIDEVESRGMTVEGVYRKSGGNGQVKQIQSGFEKDSNYNISDPDLDIHAVTSCLKQYFRKLPNPLITFEVYDSVLEAAQLPDVDRRCLAMKMALGALAPAHRDVLEYLIGHLARIVEKEALNLMTPLNISVVFAPTIMRPAAVEREMTDMQAQREAVRFLLDNRGLIFD